MHNVAPPIRANPSWLLAVATAASLSPLEGRKRTTAAVAASAAVVSFAASSLFFLPLHPLNKQFLQVSLHRFPQLLPAQPQHFFL